MVILHISPIPLFPLERTRHWSSFVEPAFLFLAPSLLYLFTIKDRAFFLPHDVLIEYPDDQDGARVRVDLE